MSYLANKEDDSVVDCTLTSNFDEEYDKIYPDLRDKDLPSLICKYPHDPSYLDIKDKIMKIFSLSNILLGSGSEDLILKLNLIFSQKNYSMGVVVPIFYRITETISSKVSYILEIELAKHNFRDYDIVWIQNPNLFSGNTHDRNELIKIIKNNPSTLFVIDEAGMLTLIEWNEYSLLSYCKELSNLIVVSTFSKIYGISGLRAGFATGNKEILSEAEKYSLTFPLSSLTELFLNNVLGQEKEIDYFRKKIRFSKSNLESLIRQDPAVCLKPSLTNCIFAYHKEKDLYRELLNNNITALNLEKTSLDEKGYVRITVHSSNKIYSLMQNAFKKILNLN